MSHKAGNTTNLMYDEKLLDMAPQVTKGQRQEGYDADILNPSPPPATRALPQDHNNRSTDIESGASPHEKHLAAGGYDPVDPPPKAPFWKTPKGLIIIAVVALVIIAAAVGGGVGATAGKKHNTVAVAAGDSQAPPVPTPPSSPTSSEPSKGFTATSSSNHVSTCRQDQGTCAQASTTSGSLPTSPFSIGQTPTATTSMSDQNGQQPGATPTSTPPASAGDGTVTTRNQ